MSLARVQIDGGRSRMYLLIYFLICAAPAVCNSWSCHVTLTINRSLVALRQYCVFTCSVKTIGYTDVLQYLLCRRTAEISGVWGQQLCQRNPPRAAGHKHRERRSSNAVLNNRVNNNEPSSERTHTFLISLVFKFPP